MFIGASPRLLTATLLAVACGGTTVKSGDPPPGSSGVGGSGTKPVSGGVPAMSQGGKASAFGGAPAGMPSIAGTPAGGAGTTGGGGSGGAAGMPPCWEGSSDIFGKSDYGNPGWHRSWFLSGCRSLVEESCALTSECPLAGSETRERFPVGYIPGQRLKVSLRFSGVVEAQEYQGGKRDAGELVPNDPYDGLWDTFYRDGEPVPSDRNVWQLVVYDNTGQPVRHYYMNAFPPNAGVAVEGNTFWVQFKKTIVVVGGGIVEHIVQAPKCRAYDNCGATAAGPDCPVTRRSLPPPDDSCSPPRVYEDPEDGQIKETFLLSLYSGATPSQPWHSQLGRLTLLAVEETNDPVNTDYPDPP